MKTLNAVLQEYRKNPKTFTPVQIIMGKMIQDLEQLNVFIYETDDFFGEEISKFVESPEVQEQVINGQLPPNFKIHYTPLSMPFGEMWIELPNNLWQGIKVPAVYLQEVTPTYQRIMLFNQRTDLLGEHLDFTSFSIVDGKMGMPKDADKKQSETYLRAYMALKQFLNNLTLKNMHFAVPKQEINFSGRVDGVFKKFKGKPHNMIYVGDTTTIKRNNPTMKLIAKADHQYEVMGHWRRINNNSIGKDRAGIRQAKGYTWVVPFVKGPEGTALIRKVRKVR